MAESNLDSVFVVWNKLQEKFRSAVSSSTPCVIPELTMLNDMVYEVPNSSLDVTPELEVVFFHGLQLQHCTEAYFTTWMSRDNSQFWLQTWLMELFPKARILIVSYDSSAKKTHESGRLDMYCTVENLVHSLVANEVGVGQAGCPVVLVGHCLGGLVLKELCLSAQWMVSRKNAERPGVERIRNLISNLRGMFFYGTPHSGSLLGDKLRECYKGALLAEIETLKASTARKNEEFNDLKSLNKWDTYGMTESRETYVDSLRRYIHVVPEASSRLYMDNHFSVDADHYEICKPKGKNDSAFQCLKGFLTKILKEGAIQAGIAADAKCSRRWVVDFEGRAHQVSSILAQENSNRIFIVGLSGIGKTTLAQQVFHNIGHNFPVTCFVSLDNTESLANCEDQLLRKIWDVLEGVIRGSNDSPYSVFHHLRENKVLMVLDNVESRHQLDALRTETWLDGRGSRLIITTTNGRLGSPSNSFQVPYLSSRESHQLFSHYAFQGGDGPQGLTHLIQRVIEKCGNFPLFLRLLGGFVSQEDVHEKELWLNLVDRLEKAEEVVGDQDYILWAKLKVCFNALNSSEKEMFLDSATIFHGSPFSFVTRIWKGSREASHLAWINLKRRFLVDVDDRGNIHMHGLLRNLGHSIACPRAAPLHKWTRTSESFWAKELITKHQGVVDTIAFKLEIVANENLTLRNITFVNYLHLQYLILEGVRTSSGRVELPTSLIYLKWKDGLFTSCPVDFTRLEKLVALELVHCKYMKSLSPAIVKASKLTWLELEGCLSLTRLPLGLSKCLEHLGLNETGLRELPSDLLEFKGLTHLTANQTQLTRVPQRLGPLKMLSTLDLSGTRLTTLPESVGDLKQLLDLDLSGTRLKSLPDSISGLQDLKYLYLDQTELSSLPESIGQLQGLERLTLEDTCVKSLPQSVGDLVNLKYLYLNEQLQKLPDSIRGLGSLEGFRIGNSELSAYPHTIGDFVDLQELHVYHTKLRAWTETLGKFSSLEIRHVRVDCPVDNYDSSLELEEVRGEEEENTAALGDEQSQMEIPSLLPQFPSLRFVIRIILSGRDFAESLLHPLFHALHHMPSLSDLELCNFNLPETIPSELGTLTRLEKLRLNNWERLSELPESLGELHGMHSFELLDIPRLCSLPESMSNLPCFGFVTIQRCESLQSMPVRVRNLCEVSDYRNIEEEDSEALDAENKHEEDRGSFGFTVPTRCLFIFALFSVILLTFNRH